MLSEELGRLIFLLAIHTDVNHSRRTIEISSVLLRVTVAVILFKFFYLLILFYFPGGMSKWNVCPCCSQFFSFLVSKCCLRNSLHELLSGGINIAAHWLTYILLCLVVIWVSFLNSLGLSKKANSVFLLANRHLSSVFHCGEFWLLATDGVCLQEAQQDLRGVLCGLSLLAPFVPVVWEEGAPE